MKSRGRSSISASCGRSSQRPSIERSLIRSAYPGAAVSTSCIRPDTCPAIFHSISPPARRLSPQMPLSSSRGGSISPIPTTRWICLLRSAPYSGCSTMTSSSSSATMAVCFTAMSSKRFDSSFRHMRLEYGRRASTQRSLICLVRFFCYARLAANQMWMFCATIEAKRGVDPCKSAMK